MLKHLADAFEREYKKYGEQLILDDYIPKNGTYFIVEAKEDGDYEVKRVLRIESQGGVLTAGMDDEYFDMVKEMDYHSQLINMNKALDPHKTIHSNNYLSLAVKLDKICTYPADKKKDAEVKNLLSPELLTMYYSFFKKPFAKYTGSKTGLYKAFEEKYGEADTKLIEQVERCMIDLLGRIEHCVACKKIWDEIELPQNADYIKVFFILNDTTETLALYQKEATRYLYPNIFITNDYNLETDGVIKGVPSNNITLNADKPSLMHPGKNQKVPSLVNLEDAVLQKKLFDYLSAKASSGYFCFYIDDLNKKIIACKNDLKKYPFVNGYHLYTGKTVKGELYIKNFYPISSGTDRSLDKIFYLEDYFNVAKDLEEKKIKRRYQYRKSCSDPYEIRDYINWIFFEGRLTVNLFADYDKIKDKDNIKDSVLRQYLIYCRDCFIDWFYHGNNEYVAPVVDKLSMALIRNTLCRDQKDQKKQKEQKDQKKQKTTSQRETEILRQERVREQLNLRWALLEYLNKERNMGETMLEIRKKLRESINTKDSAEKRPFTDDREYAYAAGQLIAYLASLSQSADRSAVVYRPLLDQSTNQETYIRRLKDEIKKMYCKYAYKINRHPDTRENRLLAMVMGYTPDTVSMDYLIAGLADRNLIYESSKTTDCEDMGNE